MARPNNNQRGGAQSRGRGRKLFARGNGQTQDNYRPHRPTPVQRPQFHFVKINGLRNINSNVLKEHLVQKASVTFLQFTAQESGYIASLATKAEALSLQNLSGSMFANKKV